MQTFTANKIKFLEQFSNEFESEFLELMKRKFLAKKVKANKVYCEYISNKNHLHMNATKWSSLSSFCEVNK